MSIQEKRLAAFEAWAAQKAGRLEKNEDGEYADSVVYGAWIGWNAGLDRVLVDLPSCDPSEVLRYGVAVEDCKRAIESAGLKVKE